MSNLPIPISPEILSLAQQMKFSGLVWKPSVGSFVWDPENFIEAPSPFPHRVYFILSLRRFLKIFGSVGKMQEQLVWIPTVNQLNEVAQQNRFSIESERFENAEQDLISIYRTILRILGSDSEA